jgi:SagB-type dehydrogenase family enzyme
MDDITAGRKFLKSDQWPEWRKSTTDQKKKVAFPPLQKPCPSDAKLIDLVAPKDFQIGKIPLIDAISRRSSRRKFTDGFLTLEELSFLLWATQGMKEVIRDGYATRRNVPSGGARHSFETYLCIQRVQGLAPGLYRYLALEHKLILLNDDPDMYRRINEGTEDQNFGSAVVFIWTTTPYRTEWRYSFVAHKLILIDAGHVCQNLYLACEAIGCGTCAIGAYNQEKMDAVLGVDGKEEMTIYCAPVGKV